jgi:endonuclease YncB( thermonuclease family)
VQLRGQEILLAATEERDLDVPQDPPPRWPVGPAAVAVASLVAFAYLLTAVPPPPPAPAPLPPVVAHPPAEPVLTPLPEAQIGARSIHAVPEEPDRPTDRHVSDEVANGPRELPPTTQKQFSGTGKVIGPASLMVGDARVQLFGIKPPDANERCGIGAAADCAETARQALTSRFPPNANIYCQVPHLHPGASAVSAICLDPDSADLGGYLVSEGLALADTSQSYDYVGAESIARNARRGLWANR